MADLKEPEYADFPHWRDRIEQVPGVLAGKPVVKGTRVSVQLITDLLEGGRTHADIIRMYSFITPEDIEACRRYKATGAVLSYFTWEDMDAWMDSADASRKVAKEKETDLPEPEYQEYPHWRDRIEQGPGVLAGKPVVKGTRLSVQLITDFLEGGDTTADIIRMYPFITPEDIEACRRYKATGAVLSYFTWEDMDAWMDGKYQPKERPEGWPEYP